MSRIAPEIVRHGALQPAPAAIPLRAGLLTLSFIDGDLRYVKWNDREVVRRIYVAVRDANWGTVPATLSDLRIDDGGDRFQVSYHASHKDGPIHFDWEATISGDPDGTLRFGMDGAARTTFSRNRIGICVLYPIACAGTAASIEHSDSSREETEFPALVAPQLLADGRPQPLAPFVDLRAITHVVGEGRLAELRFSGERFELEDQRNWIDASYKVYGTPLSLPFPVEVAAGTPVVQSVELRLHEGHGREGEAENGRQGASGHAPPTVARPSSTHLQPERSKGSLLVLRANEASDALRLPQLGLGVASHREPLDQRAIERLKALKLGHLRVDLRLDDEGVRDALDAAAAEAQALELPLEIGLRLSEQPERELKALRSWLDEAAPAVAGWLVFDHAMHRTLPWQMALAREALGSYAPGAPFGGGSAANFTELNRDWTALEAMDLLCFAACPQIHASDDHSLAETPAGLLDALKTAQARAGGRPLGVGPITLRQRFNAVATTAEAAPGPDKLPPQVDERQLSLLGAGWTLAVLGALVAGGAAAATFYETSGWRGVLETADGSPLPERFPSIAGGVFPLYFVFAAVAPFVHGEAQPLDASDPLGATGLLLRDGGLTRVIVANLAPEPLNVLIPAARPAQARVLHDGNAEQAMADPEAFLSAQGDLLAESALALPPYALAIVDEVMDDG